MSREESLGRAFREDRSAQAAELLTRFSSLLRNAYVHSANNETWTPLLEAVRRLLEPLVRDGRVVEVELQHGQFLVDAVRVRPGFDAHGAHRYLAEQLARRSIGALRITAVPELRELLALAYTLAEADETDVEGLGLLSARLSQRGVRSLRLVAPRRDEGPRGPDHGDRRRRAQRLLLGGLVALRELHEGVRAGRSVGLRGAKRFVQAAVELLAEHRGLTLALTTAKGCSGYLEQHAVNVCLHSLVLGQRLGLDKRRLGELGLAALLRDVGKVLLPAALLDRPGDLSPQEWAHFKRFPYLAVPSLLRLRGFHEGSLRQVLLAFEQQFRSAGDRTIRGRDFNLYTRIAHLAGEYDALTSARPYRPAPLMPHDALRMMVRDRQRTGVDPLLLKAFVATLGLFPVGSVVLLDSGELALVCEPADATTGVARPWVRVLAGPDGSPLRDAPLAALSERDAGGRFLRSVVAAVDPTPHGLNVAQLLLLALPDAAPGV